VNVPSSGSVYGEGTVKKINCSLALPKSVSNMVKKLARNCHSQNSLLISAVSLPSAVELGYSDMKKAIYCIVMAERCYNCGV
jgi:hypothetical protein